MLELGDLGAGENLLLQYLEDGAVCPWCCNTV